jgi:outer membrane protein OmpA-like peptidoglycan-associated protein
LQDYLIYDGIDPNRVTFYGYGESMPIIPGDSIYNSNDGKKLAALNSKIKLTHEDSLEKIKLRDKMEGFHQQNRRTELKITAVRKTNPVRWYISFSSKAFSIGDILPTKNIIYELGKPNIRPESFSFLDSLTDFLKTNSSLVIEVGDYSGSTRGSDDWNYKLSQQRSDTIKSYLMRKGIASERLRSKGYGISNPLITRLELQHGKTFDPEQQPDFYEINRRVEFKIINIEE